MSRLRYHILCLFFALQGFAAYAGDENDPFADAKGGLLALFEPVVELVKTGMILAAVAVLGTTVVKLMSGDRESAKKLVWWVVGLSVGFALMAVLSEAIQHVNMVDQGITV